MPFYLHYLIAIREPHPQLMVLLGLNEGRMWSPEPTIKNGLSQEDYWEVDSEKPYE
jgi:hypothetical protein